MSGPPLPNTWEELRFPACYSVTWLIWITGCVFV
jgi:hypothetical protein